MAASHVSICLSVKGPLGVSVTVRDMGIQHAIANGFG